MKKLFKTLLSLFVFIIGILGMLDAGISPGEISIMIILIIIIVGIIAAIRNK